MLHRFVLPLALGCMLAACALDAAPARRPNVLFLFADDLAFEAIRAFGHTDIDTPNLDRLVARGTAFTHAYNMGSWSPAVCVASRTMLVTGRSVWNAESVYRKTDDERTAGRLWPQLLGATGYRTYFTGKWHIQAKVEAAFDVARHVRAGMPRDVPAGYNRPAPGVPDPWSPSDPKFGGFWEGGKLERGRGRRCHRLPPRGERHRVSVFHVRRVQCTA
jgi:arylsulfatase A-like enzyme